MPATMIGINICHKQYAKTTPTITQLWAASKHRSFTDEHNIIYYTTNQVLTLTRRSYRLQTLQMDFKVGRNYLLIRQRNTSCNYTKNTSNTMTAKTGQHPYDKTTIVSCYNLLPNIKDRKFSFRKHR